MAYTGPVKIRDGQIEQLITLYKQTYAKLVQEITTATDSGKISKARVMARISQELEALGIEVDKWARREIPQYYLDGANLAQQDLRALGVDISKSKNFAVINQEAIKALTDDVALAFANSINAIYRNSSQLLSTAIKQQLNFTIAQGKLTGEARETISNNIKQVIQDNGITALTDKSGREWSFDTYARMLARTKAAEARNQGLTNRMLSSGYDLVQVSNHGTDHPACAAWEGRILSLTGKTPGFPTLAEASAAGLFHPNCEHAINVIVPELASKTIAYDNPYNYRETEATPGAIRQATGGPNIRQQVYHGSGNDVMPAGDNIFGNAFYVTTDPKVARVFGSKVASSSMTISKGQILNIQDQAHYQKFVNQTLAAFPGENFQTAAPKFAKSLGYKAIQVPPSFDDLGGIAILDKSVLSR